jgi:hypothetical protein
MNENDNCGEGWMVALVFIVATLAVLVVMCAPAFADTQVVGDSLTRQTYMESGGWYVNARDGRALDRNVPLVSRFAARGPDALVVALGSNDVAQRRTTATVGQAAAMPVSCVVLTTVKVYGVTRFYNVRWAEYARRWNRAVRSSGAVVADWNRLSTGQPGWFLADGLHLTESGKLAYDQMLREAVTRCPVATPE